MTMLNVISCKEGMVLAADSCVNSGVSKDKNKIMYNPQYQVVLMVYGNCNSIKNWIEKQKYRNNFEDDEIGNLEIKGPKNFIKAFIHHLKNNHPTMCGVGDTGRFGIVVAGYEEEVPTVCTAFLEKDGELHSRYPLLPRGKDSANYDFMCYDWEEGGVEIEQQIIEGNKVDIIKNNFGISFSTTLYTNQTRYEQAKFKDLDIEEAKLKSIEAIKNTIFNLKQEYGEDNKKEINVGEPITYMVLTKNGIKEWIDINRAK